MGGETVDTTTTQTQAEQALLSGLVEHGLLIPCGVPGLYGRGAVFEDLLTRFHAFVSRETQGDGASAVHFPPVMNRKVMERADYLESFPHLAGLVFSFKGNERQHHDLVGRVQRAEDYSALQSITDVVLTPAACHPLYPTCSGRLPNGGRLFDLTSYCFRHEPSADPARMQAFRMREHVRLGTPDDVKAWRDSWRTRGLELLRRLGLPAYEAPANDPFFGRAGKLLAENQQQQQLKFELVLPITSEARPTAIMSFNYHTDHFTKLYAIESAGGELAHSACLGFGLERIAIGLFKTHGFDPQRWPHAVREQLWG
ncbi:MAG TPA: amino acid--[acyl-carrier-protein] ligase [Polyangiales bacterium]|nr:amino acid--[acyl-carrier-protein] ligase [Polyangiales bacterium]